MTTPPRPAPEGWNLNRPMGPQIKELTIMLGEADLYVHMARRVELGNGHLLYEAVLTDAHGTRAIYVDHEDILACLEDTFARVDVDALPEPEETQDAAEA